MAEAGYICAEQATSANVIAFCYAFYLIGKHEFGLPAQRLRRVIRRWFFASAITSYYVGSFETNFERQLNDVKQLGSPEEFEAYFDREVAAQLTDDYFRITLPTDLDANEAMGPYWYGFVAAQVVLGAKCFLSTASLSQILAPGASGTKKGGRQAPHLPRQLPQAARAADEAEQQGQLRAPRLREQHRDLGQEPVRVRRRVQGGPRRGGVHRELPPARPARRLGAYGL